MVTFVVWLNLDQPLSVAVLETHYGMVCSSLAQTFSAPCNVVILSALAVSAKHYRCLETVAGEATQRQPGHKHPLAAVTHVLIPERCSQEHPRKESDLSVQIRCGGIVVKVITVTVVMFYTVSDIVLHSG